MHGLNIYLADGTLSGAVIMSSAASTFNAVRVKRADVPLYMNDLNYPGVYMLVIGNDTVYVGQSGLNTVAKRIFNTHTGNIDSSWHTVVGFGCKNQNISSNELLFIENALCEYAHKTYPNCVTTTPAKNKCTAAYRTQHYNLSGPKINSCNLYFQDIEFYLGRLGDIFSAGGAGASTGTGVGAGTATTTGPATGSGTGGGPTTGTGAGIQPPVVSANTELFYFKSPARDSDGKAEIIVHNSNTRARTAILKAGSKVSLNVSPNFAGANSVIKERANLTAQGKLVNRILQTDVTFKSQSGAGQFLNGTSFDGNSNWKTVNGDIPLK